MKKFIHKFAAIVSMLSMIFPSSFMPKAFAAMPENPNAAGTTLSTPTQTATRTITSTAVAITTHPAQNVKDSTNPTDIVLSKTSGAGEKTKDAIVKALPGIYRDLLSIKSVHAWDPKTDSTTVTLPEGFKPKDAVTVKVGRFGPEWMFLEGQDSSGQTTSVALESAKNYLTNFPISKAQVHVTNLANKQFGNLSPVIQSIRNLTEQDLSDGTVTPQGFIGSKWVDVKLSDGTTVSYIVGADTSDPNFASMAVATKTTLARLNPKLEQPVSTHSELSIVTKPVTENTGFSGASINLGSTKVEVVDVQGKKETVVINDVNTKTPVIETVHAVTPGLEKITDPKIQAAIEASTHSIISESPLPPAPAPVPSTSTAESAVANSEDISFPSPEGQPFSITPFKANTVTGIANIFDAFSPEPEGRPIEIEVRADRTATVTGTSPRSYTSFEGTFYPETQTIVGSPSDIVTNQVFTIALEKTAVGQYRIKSVLKEWLPTAGTSNKQESSFNENGLLQTVTYHEINKSYLADTTDHFSYEMIEGKPQIVFSAHDEKITYFSIMGQPSSTVEKHHKDFTLPNGHLYVNKEILEQKETAEISYFNQDSPTTRTTLTAAFNNSEVFDRIQSLKDLSVVEDVAQFKTIYVTKKGGIPYTMQYFRGVDGKFSLKATHDNSSNYSIVQGQQADVESNEKDDILIRAAQKETYGYRVSYGVSKEGGQIIVGYGLIFEKYEDGKVIAKAIVDYPIQKTVVLEGKTYNIDVKDGQVNLVPDLPIKTSITKNASGEIVLNITGPSDVKGYDISYKDSVTGPWKLATSGLKADASGAAVWSDTLLAPSTNRFFKAEAVKADWDGTRKDYDTQPKFPANSQVTHSNPNIAYTAYSSGVVLHIRTPQGIENKELFSLIGSYSLFNVDVDASQDGKFVVYQSDIGNSVTEILQQVSVMALDGSNRKAYLGANRGNIQSVDFSNPSKMIIKTDKETIHFDSVTFKETDIVLPKGTELKVRTVTGGTLTDIIKRDALDNHLISVTTYAGTLTEIPKIGHGFRTVNYNPDGSFSRGEFYTGNPLQPSHGEMRLNIESSGVMHIQRQQSDGKFTQVESLTTGTFDRTSLTAITNDLGITYTWTFKEKLIDGVKQYFVQSLTRDLHNGIKYIANYNDLGQLTLQPN